LLLWQIAARVIIVVITVAAVVIAVINVVIKYLQLPPHKACLKKNRIRFIEIGSGPGSQLGVKVQKFSAKFLSLFVRRLSDRILFLFLFPCKVKGKLGALANLFSAALSLRLN